MERILFEGTAPGQTQIWKLANKPTAPSPYGKILGCCLPTYMKGDKMRKVYRERRRPTKVSL